MAHFSTKATTRQPTPSEWLQVGSKIGQLVNDWSLRNDLVVNLGKVLEHSAPAYFNPSIAEIDINTDVCFGEMTTPEEIGDITKRLRQLEYPKASGAVFHESLHARFSRYSLEDASKELSNKEFSVLHHLEEGRIEALGVRYMPTNRVLLRASALEIIIGDLDSYKESLSSVYGAAFTASLALSRVDAGVLDEEDLGDLRDLIVSILGEEVLEQLRAIWVKAQAHEAHFDYQPLAELAREWVRILDALAEEKGEEQGEGGEGSESEEGEGEEGEGSDSPEAQAKRAVAQAIREALGDIAESMGISVQDELDDEIQTEEWKEEAKARSTRSEQDKSHKDTARKVFARSTADIESTGSNSRLVEVRKPTGEERIAAVSVAKSLERAKYRERSQTVVKSVLPQGRLRSRALVQNAAYKAVGVQTRVEAWRHTSRKHTEDPTLTIGVMVDISGSMGSAMQPMATTAWVLSEAGRRVQAESAMVYFGQSVFPTLKPGQHLNEVKVYSAPDATERFDEGFKALDGTLNLLYGSGARMLVVVSDGYYTPDESRKAKEWVAECKRNGVAVLWLTYDTSGSAQRYAPHGATVVNVSGSLADATKLIGETATKILTEVGKRNI